MTPSWLKVKILELVCAIKGHNYAQHFTVLGISGPYKEIPWCDRCGGEQS